MSQQWSAITDFEALVGRELIATLGEQSFGVRLVEVGRLGDAPLVPGGRIPFHVVFETLDAIRAPQDTYAFRDESGNGAEIFVVPIAATESGGTKLEAVYG